MPTTGDVTKAASRDHFDRWAGDYENDRVSRRLAELQRLALATLSLGAGDRLLDVGCGTGAGVRSAAPGVVSATGIDLSAGMVARATELAAGLPNVTFLQADVEALPFPDGAFTALLCTTSFHHYPDPVGAAGEMARVLAPGGRLALADMVTDRWPMRLADAVLRRAQSSHVGCHRAGELGGLLAGAGLRPGRPRPALRGFYAIVPAARLSDR